MPPSRIERDATDQRDHGERGDDDDLAALGSPIGCRCDVAMHGVLVGGIGSTATVHGCLGQAAASAATVRALRFRGQLYSTESCDVAVNVTPFPNRMLLMNGVIGR